MLQSEIGHANQQNIDGGNLQQKVLYSKPLHNNDATPNSDIIGSVTFIQQPPSVMRKLANFNFTISLRDKNGGGFLVESVKFTGYLPEYHNGSGEIVRNGTAYQLELRGQPRTGADQTVIKQELTIRMVDSETKQPILYQGSDINPNFKRVLLVHETSCQQCTSNKKCGKLKSYPSIQKINDNVQFFLKCNQNCRLSTGRFTKTRRFMIEISVGGKVLAYSNNIDIVNTCLTGDQFMKRRKVASIQEQQQSDSSENDQVLDTVHPIISLIAPSQGFVSGGTEVHIIGSNFKPGMKVTFGNVAVVTKYVAHQLLKAMSPEWPQPESVQIGLVDDVSGQCQLREPFQCFQYLPDCLDEEFAQLSRFMAFENEEPRKLSKKEILKRTLEMAKKISAQTLHTMQLSSFAVNSPPDSNLSVHSNSPQHNDNVDASYVNFQNGQYQQLIDQLNLQNLSNQFHPDQRPSSTHNFAYKSQSNLNNVIAISDQFQQQSTLCPQ